MSDESNKLVRQSHEIAPAEDFARKIEERLRAEPEPQREPERKCRAQYRLTNGDAVSCKRVAQHKDGHVNANAAWMETCQSVSPDGEPCVYQLEHQDDHGNGRDATWAQQAIAQIGEPDVFAILGELMQKSPAFAQYVAKRAAAARPIMQRVPLQKARAWVLSFGPEKIQPQSSVTLVQRVQMYFRGEKLVNTGDIDGLYIDNIFVGNKMQMPNTGVGIGVRAFEPAALGSGVRFDVAQPALDISMVVRNVSDEVRTFAATLFGKAAV